MSGIRVSLLLTSTLLLGMVNALASTFAVGTCKPSLSSFSTISAAVVAVPPFSTILVCPGTYPEQVTINQPLTLKGTTSSNSVLAIITVPPNGLTQNVTSIFQGPIFAQVGVTAGPVNISNITVDGSNNNVNAPWLAGIFYQGGSSGVINEVATRNQIDAGFGVGIWVENGTSNAESITIENSSVHDVDNSGIVAGDATLSATIKGNSVSAGDTGLDWDAAGSATGNLITAGSEGIFHQNVGTVSGNTIVNSPVGIFTFSGGSSDTSNRIFNSSLFGIDMGANGQTVKSNSITETPIAIEFSCTTGDVVSGNKITDAGTGLDGVPSSFSGANSFFSVGTIRNDGCGFAPAPKTGVPIPTVPR